MKTTIATFALCLLALFSGCQESNQKLTGWILTPGSGAESKTVRIGATDGEFESGGCLTIYDGNVQSGGFYSGYRVGSFLGNGEPPIEIPDQLIQQFYTGAGIEFPFREGSEIGFQGRAGTLFRPANNEHFSLVFELTKGDSPLAPSGEEEAFYIGARAQN